MFSMGSFSLDYLNDIKQFIMEPHMTHLTIYYFKIV